MVIATITVYDDGGILNTNRMFSHSVRFDKVIGLFVSQLICLERIGDDRAASHRSMWCLCMGNVMIRQMDYTFTPNCQMNCGALLFGLYHLDLWIMLCLHLTHKYTPLEVENIYDDCIELLSIYIELLGCDVLKRLHFNDVYWCEVNSQTFGFCL